MASLQISIDCQHYDLWIHYEDTNFENINYQEKEPRGLNSSFSKVAYA
jgi:hypothetical protein